MLKHLLSGAIATAATAATLLAGTAEKYPFGTICYNGGAVIPVDMTMVHTSNEHLNFCFAHHFSDNTIRLGHSAGIHTVTEHGCSDISYDNGKTWQKTTESRVGGFNAYEMLDGRKASISCWSDVGKGDAAKFTTHTLTRHIEEKDGSYTTDKITLDLPFESWCQLHRDVLRCKDGRLLMTVKGSKKGSNKWMAYLIESTDDGATWHYLSTILEDKEEQYAEGPNEAEVIELANGDILCYVRVASVSPLHQLRSTDGGKTWGEDHTIADFGVAPAATILQNGTLVVITGRPGTYLLIDFTGTGNHYEKYTVYGGSGSSYASVLEIEPNRVMVIYDESDFGAWRNLARMSRIIALTLDIQKDDSLALKDDNTSGYAVYYSAINETIPETAYGFLNAGYNKQGVPENLAETRKIAEYPETVLHITNHGKESNTRFPSFLADIPTQTTSFKGELCLRLNDLGADNPQFAIRFALPNKEDPSGSLFGWLGFANGYISYTKEDGTKHPAPLEFTSVFKTFIVEADTQTLTYKVFVKGEEKPLIESKLAPHRQIPVGFQFGDGSTEVYGDADLAYIGYSVK